MIQPLRLAGITGALLSTACAGMLYARAQSAQASLPAVAGKWTGTWGAYAPPVEALAGAQAAPAKRQYTQAQRAMDCTVERAADGKWQATFEGECGRPYKYTIKMLGRQAGDVVLFQGTADLGEMDGGVYDWIGRANGKEFIGFFTSRAYTGTFRLARPPAK